MKVKSNFQFEAKDKKYWLKAAKKHQRNTRPNLSEFVRVACHELADRVLEDHVPGIGKTSGG